MIERVSWDCTMATMAQVVWLVVLGLMSLLLCAEAGWLGNQGYHEQWVRARGTWYGDPYGEGSSGELMLLTLLQQYCVDLHCVDE